MHWASTFCHRAPPANGPPSAHLNLTSSQVYSTFLFWLAQNRLRLSRAIHNYYYHLSTSQRVYYMVLSTKRILVPNSEQADIIRHKTRKSTVLRGGFDQG
ncbi:hypothetical protein AX17_006050 [Amanita inopinata Kibby_2008]|nr:hypothetical protein AX17_006050 [Amanita inopinata Kibby_2008]